MADVKMLRAARGKMNVPRMLQGQDLVRPGSVADMGGDRPGHPDTGKPGHRRNYEDGSGVVYGKGGKVAKTIRHESNLGPAPSKHAAIAGRMVSRQRAGSNKPVGKKGFAHLLKTMLG